MKVLLNTDKGSPMKCLKMLLFVLLFGTMSVTANASEPPTAPIFRIEIGAHTAKIVSIATDRQGRWVVTASGDKTARLYEVATGKLIRTFRPPMDQQNEGTLAAIALSPDGATIAVGGWTGLTWDKSGSIYLFDTASGSLTHRISGLPDVISALSISPDGTTLAAGLREKNGIRLFRLSDWAEVGRDTEYGGDSFSVHFAADGRLVSSSVDGYVRLYAPLGTTDSFVNGADASRLRLVARKETPAGCIPIDARFSPKGDKIAVGYRGGANLDILDGNDLKELNRADGMYEHPDGGGVRRIVAWSSDGSTLYSRGQLSDDAACVYLWKNEGKGRKEEISLGSKNASIAAMVPLPSGDLVLATTSPALILLDRNGEVRKLATSQMVDFTGIRDEFLLSENGSEIAFEFEHLNTPYRFDLPGRSLSTLGDNRAGNLLNKRINVNPWKDGSDINPDLFLPGESSSCIAYNSDGFALGTFGTVGTGGLKRFWGGTKSAGKVWSHLVAGFPHACNISRDGRVAAAAFDDGTIRWYRMTDGKELLSFFPHADKKRWVIWTPEGFFDHSPGGEELIGYHLNRGKDKEAEFIPVSKLYNTFYRPDLVNAAFEGKDISEFAEAIDINKILTTKTLAPKVRFLTRSGQVEKPEQEINAEICDNGGGVGDVTLYLNGMPIAVEGGGRGIKVVGRERDSNCFSFNRTVSLDNGDNVISIMASNKLNTIESNRDSVTIKHTSRFTGKPNLHILTIAVDKYRDGDLRLKYSNADAKAVAALLQAKGEGLFGTVNRYAISDADVTREKLEQTFASIGKKARREDLFILFVAGHGITYAKDGTFYFLPVNFRYSQDEDIVTQGVSMNDFKRYLAYIQSAKSLLMLDTCNSGSFADAIASRGVLEKSSINKLTRAVGRHTIVASSKSQVALEGIEGHGAFSYVLLDGIKGKAANHKGEITVNSLVSFVESTLPDLTYKKWGYEQIPQKSLVGEDFQFGSK
jgi:WD40 repeat protein